MYKKLLQSMFVALVLLMPVAVRAQDANPSFVADAINASSVRLIPNPMPGNALVFVGSYLVPLIGNDGKPDRGFRVVPNFITYDEWAELHLNAFLGAPSSDAALHSGQIFDWFGKLVAAGVVDPTVEGMKAFLYFNSLRSSHPQWSAVWAVLVG
jgi:hypothetical protein